MAITRQYIINLYESKEDKSPLEQNHWKDSLHVNSIGIRKALSEEENVVNKGI